MDQAGYRLLENLSFSATLSFAVLTLLAPAARAGRREWLAHLAKSAAAISVFAIIYGGLEFRRLPSRSASGLFDLLGESVTFSATAALMGCVLGMLVRWVFDFYRWATRP